MRRISNVTIDAGRDAAKVFVITEMPARQSEKWATRAFLALAKSGVEIPDNIAESGLAGVASLGLSMFGKISFSDAEPLLDEMMTCVSIQPSPSITRALNPDGSDIEDVSTIVRLRREVLDVHLGFSLAGAISKFANMLATANVTPNTSTSAEPSAP